MKKVYIRSNYSIVKISLVLMISLIPLIIGGFYKHGLKLYQADLVTTYGLFKPLILTISGLLIGILVNLIYLYIIKRKKASLIDSIFSSFHPIYGLLVASVVSININIWLFITITFVILLLSKFILPGKYNVPALTMVIIVLITQSTGGFSFLNAYETGKVLHLSLVDYLIGMGSGGVNTTYTICLIIGLIVLANQEYYKRAIPLFGAITYFSCLIIYAIINNLDSAISIFFTNGVLFSLVYLATDCHTSSYTREGKIIFGVIIGLITFGFYFIYPPIAVFAAILFASLMHELIDKLVWMIKSGKATA